MAMYLIRQAVDILSMPLALTFIILLIALFLRWRGRSRAAFATTVGAIALLYLSAIQPVSTALLKPLEIYPALDDAHLPRGIAGIAVLGSYFDPRSDTPITGQLPGAGLERAAEGVRLAKKYGNVRLVLSGGVQAGMHETPSAYGYVIFARQMGIDPASITVVDRPTKTSEEARELARLFGSSPFLVVTSVSHMKRAMMLFEGTGAHPIPAPTGHRARWGDLLSFLTPKTEHLMGTREALHEYLGILAIRAGLG
jgi:uncharacterized SAM-binding protein YcdF (DUF218 family)